MQVWPRTMGLPDGDKHFRARWIVLPQGVDVACDRSNRGVGPGIGVDIDGPPLAVNSVATGCGVLLGSSVDRGNGKVVVKVPVGVLGGLKEDLSEEWAEVSGTPVILGFLIPEGHNPVYGRCVAHG